MNTEQLQKTLDLVIDFANPVYMASKSPDAAKRLLLELGYLPPAQLAIFEQFGGAIEVIKDVVEEVGRLIESEGEMDTDKIGEIVEDLSTALPTLIETISDLGNQFQNQNAGSQLLAQTDILAQLPVKLLNLLLVKFIINNYRSLFSILQLFKVIEIEEITEKENEFYFPSIQYHFHWDKIGDLFSKPEDLLIAVLKNENEYFYYELIYAIQDIGLALKLFSSFKYPNLDVLKFINSDPDIENWEGTDDLEILHFPLMPYLNPDLGIDIYPLINRSENIFTGLVLGIGLDSQLSFDLSDKLKLVFEISSHLANALGITIDMDNNFQFINDLFDSPQGIADNLVIGLKTSLIGTGDSDPESEEKLFRIGTPDSSRLEMGSFGLALGFNKGEEVEIFFEVDLKDGLLAINLGGADGFVSDIAGENNIESNFNIGFGISNKAGLYFKGGSGLEIRLPTHIELGPIEIQGLTISLIFAKEKLPLILSATIAANLGPLKAVVENIGLQANFSFPPNNAGNLGPLDLSLGFKPPNGVGLSVDAGAVKGGGYLFFDYDREEYAGALELVISEWIAVKAIGLVTTRLPDGSKGFSMVIIVSVEFGTGIQLGLGFTLLGVGGLLGLNRTVSIDPLAEGVRTGSAVSIMFPKDIVANAPKIISDLKAFFPAKQDQFLIGPMAKIGYGTPILVSLTLGVIIEFPDVSITILGVLKVSLPDENAEVLKLQVNFIGRIEPSNKLLWFEARLFDSRILFITIEGGMGLLVKWGDASNFVFSVGGFHPRYNPPPLPFSEPPRLAISILNESYARIRIEGYFAVTSNTVQFGARAELYFGFSALNVEGYLGFDALFQFDPFYFIFEFSVGLSVKFFGFGLFSLSVSGMLEGPTKWHIKGKAKWKITWLGPTIRVNIDETWGEDRQTELPLIEIFPIIEREFDAITNWEAVVPNNGSTLVSLRKLGESEPGTSEDNEVESRTLVLHPVGTLRISQRKVPIKLKLDKFGNQKPSDVNEFSISAAIAGGNGLTMTPVREQFAPGEFIDLDNSNKLSSPGFEKYESGIEVKPEGEQLQTSMAVKRNIRYETIIIDNNFKRFQIHFFKDFVAKFTLLFGVLFNHFLKGNVVTKSIVSKHYQDHIKPNSTVITVEPQEYTVANIQNNKPVMDETGQAMTHFSSQMEANDFMNSQINSNPKSTSQMHVIPNTEVNTAA